MDRHQRITDLFHATRGLEAAQRDNVLSSACNGDAQLRSEVESLLHYHEHSNDGLEHPLLSPHDTAWLAHLHIDGGAVPHSTPQQIGRYKLLGVLGQGGMGTVYRAWDDRLKRPVALKVIRAGVTSSSMLRRFELEAQILGRLRHPGIAQIFESGVAETELGPQPFFAMELCEGLPLIEFARQRKLSLRQRLELMASIADAIEHAHGHGVIHRDLKPANIVVVTDAQPNGSPTLSMLDHAQPKVLDFGVARLSDLDAPITTVAADAGTLIGTIHYMSPEQVCGGRTPGGQPIDRRCDVYSLGVILYELLTERLPHDLRGCNIPEAVRVIEDADPAPLSSIDRVFRGDLETIVAKAMEKDRAQRYQSAADLAEDIRRYLHTQPLLARPASAAYQLRKFARRNKAVVSAVGALLAVLIMSVVATSLMLADSRRHAGRAEQVNRVLHDILGSTDPMRAQTPSLSVQELLDDASARLDAGQLLGQPDVECEVRLTLARAYVGHYLHGSSVPHFHWVADYKCETLGERHPDSIRALLDLATAAHEAAWYRETVALPTFQRAARLARDALGEDGGSRLLLLEAERGLGDVLRALDRNDEAAPLLNHALRGLMDALGPDDPRTALAMVDLGQLEFQMKRTAQAEALYVAALNVFRNRNDVFMVAQVSERLTDDVYAPQDRLEEAWNLRSEVTAALSRSLGNDHKAVLIGDLHRTDLLCLRGEWSEAAEMARSVLERARRRYGEGSNPAGSARWRWAYAMQAMGDHQRALEIIDADVIESPVHDAFLGLISAEAMLQLGRFEEAESVAAAAHEVFTTLSDPTTTYFSSEAARLVGIAMTRQGRAHEAEPMLRCSLDEVQDDSVFVWRAPITRALLLARAQGALGECLVAQGKVDEGGPLVIQSLVAMLQLPSAGPSERTQAYERFAALCRPAATRRPQDDFMTRGKIPMR